MSYEVVPRCVPGSADQIFLVEYRPAVERSCVVIVPPFAEEMNRSRPMFHRVSCVLAEKGIKVIVPDLSGTGDSPGEFGDATWQAWQGDLASVLSLAGDPSLVSLIGVRLGALLAAEVVGAPGRDVGRMIFWNPCPRGSVFIQQFLRLRTLSSLFGKSAAGESLAELKASLLDGEAVEVAGYRIAPELYAAIAGADLHTLAGRIDSPVHWFEMVASDSAAFPAAAKSVIDLLESTGIDVSSDAIPGPKFWSTLETTFSDALIKRTALAITGE